MHRCSTASSRAHIAGTKGSPCRATTLQQESPWLLCMAAGIMTLACSTVELRWAGLSAAMLCRTSGAAAASSRAHCATSPSILKVVHILQNRFWEHWRHKSCRLWGKRGALRLQSVAAAGGP